jgi:transcriptional regulator with XRE-family HTH domain
MARKPFAETRLAKYIDQRALELKGRKTQGEVATEAGFANPNMLTMLKQGATRVPLDRVPALAQALDCDPAWLLRLALEQGEGSTAAAALYDIMGPMVTANERVWLAEIRDASGDSDPRLTSRARTSLRGIFGK